MTVSGTPFSTLRSELNNAFPERAPIIDGALAAVLAGEHVLLLGPPGTAKSALVRSLAQAFGAAYFERLMTKFSTPEELFGPISLKALEQDSFRRNVTGKLPEAEIAFIDETFRSNSAILNSLLTLMNERVFHNDGAPLKCPLVTLFGAANDLPDGKDLEALFDRFLLRFDVAYLLRPSSFRRILAATGEPSINVALTMADLRREQHAASRVTVTDETIDALMSVREQLRAEGIVASDRRWRKSLGLLKGAAHLIGETTTAPEDLTLLVDALWREPKERPKIAKVVGTVADPVGAKSVEIADAARETQGKLERTRVEAGPGPTGRAVFVREAASRLSELHDQLKTLDKLAANARRRASIAVMDARNDVAQIHAELAREVSASMGLGRR